VLIVDSGYLPSAARADIAAIRRLTPLPVRYLVNTHWHYDHNNGNAEYAKAFPGVQIVVQAETKRIMDVTGPGYFASVTDSASASNKAIAALRAQLSSGKNDKGTSLSAQERDSVAADLAVRENEQREFRGAVYARPTVAFDREMSVDLGARSVRLMNFGRGNTPGDAVVYLPAQRVLATGDLVVHPVPFAFNSSPAHWVRVMDELLGIDATTIVPGHGPVMHDAAYLRDVRELLASAVAQAQELARKRVPLEQAVKQVNLEPFRAKLTHGDRNADAWFDALVGVLPERAYREARGVY